MSRPQGEIKGLGLTLGCRLPGVGRRMKWSAKRVESFWVPCLDAGSTPATSTRYNLDQRLIKSVVFFV